MTYALWTVQALLALIFLFTGGVKLVMPLDMLAKQLPLSGWLLRSLGVAEIAGALGLVLPGLLRVLPVLTPLAAGGLVIIMAGATVWTLATAGGALALVPAVVGCLAACVGYGRWRLAPHARADRGASGGAGPLDGPSSAT